ncbi:hypothetical protein NHP190012_07190 [Helicobacter sp. NHP19-012]|uniref:Organic solvent tolerance-like N-terminal domain-containing protein n=2 Tax=Helicobacter gastrofelis TaxID=2849642 RepID=A0ABN6I8N7_9HELI|nr:hypothetical protein NHP190012_07190 [Helicobacter sp. NHP19-012]
MGGLILFFLRPQRQAPTFNGDFAKIELRGFSAFEGNATSTDLNIKGSHALQFSDHEVLYDFVLSKFDNDSQVLEHARGEVLVRRGDLYSFPKGVLYTTSNHESFWSQRGVYNHAKQIFQGEGNFLLNGPEGHVSGQNIAYNHKTQVLQAQGIHAIINLAEAEHPKGRHTQRFKF